MTPALARQVLVLAMAVLPFAACADEEGATSDAPPSAGPDVSAPEPPPLSAPGTGTVVLGGRSSSFSVTSCRLEADPEEPEGARTLLAVEGEGTTESGVDFAIAAQRFSTGTDVQTFTDTVTYRDSARILQAQRIEVAGQVTDLRDPDATSALIRPRSDGLSAAGLASAPGAGPDDEGLLGIAFDATC